MLPFVPDNESRKLDIKTEDQTSTVVRRQKVSHIALNIPSAAPGAPSSRPSSIVSTNTSDEGGFNEPSPKIEARLKPHEESLYQFPLNESEAAETDSRSPEDVDEYGDRSAVLDSPKLTAAQIEALYAVPHKTQPKVGNLLFYSSEIPGLSLTAMRLEFTMTIRKQSLSSGCKQVKKFK